MSSDTIPEAREGYYFQPSRSDLIARAAQRLRMAGVSIRPPITSPHIQFNHVDGPVLHRLDGGMHWLTWRERFAVWRGTADAWSLERDIQRKEWSNGHMPRLGCDYFPFGTPPHRPCCPAIAKAQPLSNPQEVNHGK